MSSDMLPSRCPGGCGTPIALFRDHCEKKEGKIPCSWLVCPDTKCDTHVDTKLHRFYYIRANKTISGKL